MQYFSYKLFVKTLFKMSLQLLPSFSCLNVFRIPHVQRFLLFLRRYIIDLKLDTFPFKTKREIQIEHSRNFNKTNLSIVCMAYDKK